MTDYNFENLNDKEFEILVCDLLANKEGCQVDRYKAGKDGGVDGRFFNIKNGETIIQSKHWPRTGIQKLIKECENNEADKLKKLNPKRYIFVTSLPLSLENKKKIKDIFKPYIQDVSDVLGQENLNDLLKVYPDILKNHYKLWFSSTAIFESFFDRAIESRSKLKVERILEKNSKYVLTDNHKKALAVLNKLRVVIITGDAGIGKTTLAEQLILQAMKEDYKLYVIEDDISEAEAVVLNKDKKVFYFDDFLGRNFLEALVDRKDSRIAEFIAHINNSSDKFFILTSRSTVLNSALLVSDVFQNNNTLGNEYKITISSLSDWDKARILYNCVWFGDLSESYIEQIYKNKNYHKIIKHNNFNPRLVDFITDPKKISDVPPNDYWDYIVRSLNEPELIWEDVFERQLNESTRLGVSLVVFNGGRIKEDDLFDAYQNISKSIPELQTNPLKSNFKGMTKLATGSMLNRQLYDKEASYDLFNPSVADYLLTAQSHSEEFLEKIFLSLKTTKSIENLISLKKNNKIKSQAYKKIILNLAKHRLNKAHFEKNKSYFLLLTNALLDENEPLPHDVQDILLEIVEDWSDFSFPFNQLEETCNILKFCYNHNVNKYADICADFIIYSANDLMDKDEFEILFGFSEYISSELAYGAIKFAYVAYFQDNLRDILDYDDILEDYYHEDQYDDAFYALIDYLELELSKYGIAKDVVNKIASNYDILDHLNDNMMSRARGGEIEGDPHENYDTLDIDDYFERL